MEEYELYVPLHDNRGMPFDPSRLASLKDQLLHRFGGFTHFPQESTGEWTTGGQTFRDRIVILRVLTDDRGASSYFHALKRKLAEDYGQKSFLITVRQLRTV